MAALIVASALSVRGYAKETDRTDEMMITIPFYTAGMWEMTWDFPYSDRYFTESSEDFSRDLAKASLGLALSAFRQNGKSPVPNQYGTYLGKAGFRDIYAFGYDKPTATDTLSGVIASKRINDFTLIAVSPCGQGYGKEWGGNLQVGTGDRHEGFDKGAQILEREIFSYIEKQKLTGKLKLWISSYSRGAAISNLTAADLIESGRFDDVYAYLYAVPRTTKTDIGYPNICNICGAYDPVTQVPLESWGYFRHGWDLYLPAAETTAEYESLLPHADKVTRAVADDRFRYNPEMNYAYHLIIEFIGEMFPDEEEYVAKIQEVVMGLWAEANPDQIFQILEAIFASLDDLDRRQEYSREVIMDYLDYIASARLGDTRDSTAIRDVAWAEDQGISVNLIREHMPYIYLSWIFSDLSDEQLMYGGFSTRRLAVIGDVDVEVWQDDVFLNGLDQNGKQILRTQSGETIPAGSSDRSVFAVRYGLTTLVFLPANDDFRVRIRTKEYTGFNYRADTCYLPSTYGTSDGNHVVLVGPGTYELRFLKYKEELNALTALEGKVLRDTLSDREYSPTMAMKILIESENHLTVRGIILNVIILLAAVTVFLLICLAVAVVHRIKKKKHGPYSSWYVIVPHFVMLVLFVWITIYFTKNLYLITYARVAFAAASCLVVILLSLRGLIRNRNLPNALILAGIITVSVLNVFIYQRSQIVGKNLLINVLYLVIMAVLAGLAAATFGIKKTALCRK